MDKICEKIDCTGCQACKQICPKSAIEMIEDEYGHIYPSVDKEKCIDCGICEKTCPSVHTVGNHYPLKVFAGWVKNKVTRKKSTSGGISYQLSRYIISEGGYFCGVVWNPETKCTQHKIVNDFNSLEQFQGSKYSHSDTANVFIEIKTLLNAGEKVLFTGTPCQVAGLKKFLRKDFTNLYTVDLICHGVPSRKVLRDRINQIETLENDKIVNILSRVKMPNQYLTTSIYFLQGGGDHKERFYSDPFYRCFVDNFCLRPNCYECKYSTPERVSDITLGDFWGFEPNSLAQISYLDGTSAICVNSSKGLDLIRQIEDYVYLTERSFSDASSSNRNLIQPQKRPEKYEEFWKKYQSGVSLQELCEEYFPPINYALPIKTKIKAFIKMLFPVSAIKNFIKR